MSDFEYRLRDALSAGAEDAPDASELADGARRRSRARRRGRLVVAAAVAVAVVVPVGVAVLGDGSRTPPAADDPFPDPEPAATRIETWHDIQLEVPASWGYGARTGWCAGREAETPVVHRPDMAVNMVDCAPPHYSFGVTWSENTFRPAYPSGHVWRYEPGDWAEYPAGAWLGHWYDDQYLVEVAAADKQTVQEIVDSVQRVEGVDGNGCPVVDEDDAGDAAVDEVTVCRYDGKGRLEQSERLTGVDGESARRAIDEAPERHGGRACKNGPGEYVVMSLGGVRVDIQYSGNPACMDRGVFADGDVRLLTEDVMYWALSPGWSGSVERGMPLPDQLRQLAPVQPTEPWGESACLEQIGPPDYVSITLGEGPAVVCRYELDWDGESGGTFLLDQEATLTEQEEQRVTGAIDAAPEVSGLGDIHCRRGPGELYLVVAVEQTSWVYNTECHKTGVEQPALIPTYRAVTQDLLGALGSPYGLLR